MKILYRFILTIIIFSGVEKAIAQNICGSNLALSIIEKKDPEHYKRIMEIEAHTTKLANNMASRSSGVISIPVVVHVLHNGEPIGTGFNISNAQIHSQIDVLNEDFRRQNADASNTPFSFLPVASDVEIEFFLACVDPEGNPTNGIVRTYTTKSSFSISDSNENGIYDDGEEAIAGIKYAPTGSPAWPADKYLNIWVCNLVGDAGLVGYAHWPSQLSSQPNTDGIVVRTTAFGKTGNVVSPNHKGRVTTHEVGHWLNLYHIWGEGGCSSDDFVADTPNQFGRSYYCPPFPQLSCTFSDMFMNYMDLTNDECMNLFTEGQKTRMRALFSSGGVRESFVTCTLIADVCTSPTSISGGGFGLYVREL